MVSSFDEIPDKAHFSIQIINNNDNKATHNIQEKIEHILLDNFEFVFSYGTGSNETLNRSEYGYVVPDGSMWAKEFDDLENQLNERIHNADINVNVRPLIISEENFNKMRQVGENNGLDALKDFVDEINKD